jgi:hypothetical protein
LVTYLVNAFRVVVVAFIMALTAGLLWLLVGIISSGAGDHSPTFVVVAVTAIAAAALFAGGYISARYIAPRALIHPVVAALGVSLLCLLLFASGDVGGLTYALPLVAACLAASGAGVARSIGPPPNNRMERPREL